MPWPNSNEDLYEIKQHLELPIEVYKSCQNVEAAIKIANRDMKQHLKQLIKLMDKLSAARNPQVKIDISIDTMLQKLHLQEGGSHNIDQLVQAVKKLNKSCATSSTSRCDVMEKSLEKSYIGVVSLLHFLFAKMSNTFARY